MALAPPHSSAFSSRRCQLQHPPTKVSFIETAVNHRKKPRNGPFLRWAGGKRRLVPLVVELACEVFDEDEGYFYDPFLGGGSIPFGLIDYGRFRPERIRISDINETLVKAYISVQSGDIDFLEELELIQKEFDLRPGEQAYADLRAQFNARRFKVDARQAARFLALNSTSFNGLWRENSLGEYNVPFGKLKNPMVFDEVGLGECARKLQGVKISSSDYKNALFEVGSSDIVFLDPPYLPISESASFSAYHGRGFGVAEHIELSNEILRLASIGVEVILCNSFCSLSVDIYQNCGLFLYKHFVGRSIAANGDRRENVEELIGTTFPIPEEILEEFFIERVTGGKQS